MGRSVSTPSNCALVAYASFDADDGDWEDYMEDLRSAMAHMAPSMWNDDGWAGREDRVLMRNCHAEFGVSEYCGLVAVWLRVRPDAAHEALASSWCETVAKRFRRTFGQLQKIGTASNGESFYQWINGHGPATRSEPLLDRG